MVPEGALVRVPLTNNISAAALPAYAQIRPDNAFRTRRAPTQGLKEERTAHPTYQLRQVHIGDTG